MPKAEIAINGFTAKQVAAISGLSLHMINYLAREAYLLPSYTGGRTRGRVRYYSYRDLVAAKLVQKLCRAGVELRRLKRAIKGLSSLIATSATSNLGLVVTDGVDLYLPDENGTLVDLARGGQLTFAFVLDVGRAQAELKAELGEEYLKHFNLTNRPLRFK